MVGISHGNRRFSQRGRRRLAAGGETTVQDWQFRPCWHRIPKCFQVRTQARDAR